ncbi:hypothetical protein [Saccharopolyspora pogona]|uniref:hypothetical protein n=1 Tax=Saccharopolyspora pogona TaxID=333966 RepID=UPI00295BFE40|nr:hypothetical protein [Saccharopolyspora pogona]
MSAMLSRSTTGELSPEMRPLVDPGELRPRIVHFGLGAFHRAHQAVYTWVLEDRFAAERPPWSWTARSSFPTPVTYRPCARDGSSCEGLWSGLGLRIQSGKPVRPRQATPTTGS